ncbi:MAG: Hsp20/alpha crystallin family protein [Ferruginibacter sp.]|nr:Hsp20/alpha crystallin family protein [Cytophagales bacterium]
MTLIRRVNSNLPNLMESFLSRDLSDVLSNHFHGTLPAVNVVESEDELRVEVAAPGLKKENFKLNVNHNQLTISAVTETNQENTNGKHTRREFNYGSFQRSFTLPLSVDTEKIGASYVDGVLRISLPKREEAKVKPARAIEVA